MQEVGLWGNGRVPEGSVFISELVHWFGTGIKVRVRACVHAGVRVGGHLEQ